MKYSLDTSTLTDMPMNELMAHRATLEQLNDIVRQLMCKREGEMVEASEKVKEQRNATRESNSWVNKNVAKRRLA